MNGTCHTCGHEGAIYVEYDEDCPNDSIPYCPRCMSEDVSCDTPIQQRTFSRHGAVNDDED